MKRYFLLVVLIGLCMTWVSLPQAQAADEIIIGVITPLSGGTAHYGRNCLRGMEMAVEEVNAAGGIKIGGKAYKVKIESFDDEGKSDKAATGGRKLVSQFKPPIIFTPASWSAFPLMGFNEKMNFIIMATSQTPEFTKKGNKLVIRAVNSVETSMGPWVKLILKNMKANNLNIKRVGVLEVNTEVGKKWAEEFMKNWKANGGEITGKESLDANQTDYYTQLTSILKEKPDAIMVGMTDEPTSIVVKQAREQGFKGIFISSAATDGKKLMELAGAERLQFTYIEQLASALGGPEFDVFDKKYRAKFNNEAPHLVAGLAYEGGRAITLAIAKAQSLDPAKIHTAMASVLPIPGCFNCGRDMDPKTGEVYFPVYLRLIKDGKFEGIKD